MTTYQIDPSHSQANFSVKHMMIAKVRGGFEKLSGKFNYNPENLAESNVDVTIDANSINTHETQRDLHLRGADFFDVEKYPSITFKSIRFDKNGEDLLVLGNLTIHGVTKQTTLELEAPSAEQKDPWGNVKIGVSGHTKIKRKEFGLTWNAALETGGVLVGDEVSITLDIQFVKNV
jgi:polyisoprenoid-binding protein YceI